jgi:hypothetical protein
VRLFVFTAAALLRHCRPPHDCRPCSLGFLHRPQLHGAARKGCRRRRGRGRGRGRLTLTQRRVAVRGTRICAAALTETVHKTQPISTCIKHATVRTSSSRSSRSSRSSHSSRRRSSRRRRRTRAGSPTSGRVAAHLQCLCGGALEHAAAASRPRKDVERASRRRSTCRILIAHSELLARAGSGLTTPAAAAATARLRRRRPWQCRRRCHGLGGGGGSLHGAR